MYNPRYGMHNLFDTSSGIFIIFLKDNFTYNSYMAIMAHYGKINLTKDIAKV